MGLNLIELSEREQALMDALDALDNTVSDSPLTDEQQAALIDEYLSAAGDLRGKIDNYCGLIESLAARGAYRIEQSQRIFDLGSADNALAEKLRRRLQAMMQLRGELKIETDFYKLSVRRNGGIAPLMVNPIWEKDPAEVPEAFHRVIQQKIELNRRAIIDALNAGEPVDGCTFGERGAHLVIQ